MGKPSPPQPPDYIGAAKEQGAQNIQSAIATNFLNQASQIGPTGTLTYDYNYDKGLTLPGGQKIPATTATTVLSPEQQELYNQQTGISRALNELAQQGIGYVGEAANAPYDQSKFPQPVTSIDQGDAVAIRDRITNAMMERLQPYVDRDRAALENRLANQGITKGSEAYGWDQDIFNRGVNDQRIAALLAGGEEQQAEFSRGLAGGQFANEARARAIQEADYFRNQPLNMLNALRSGNQVTMPQFGSVTAGSNINPAPIYQATADQYGAALQAYQAQLAARGGMLGGLSSLAGLGAFGAFGGFK